MAVWKNNRKFAIGKQRLGIMIEIPFVCISLTAFIRALCQRNR